MIKLTRLSHEPLVLNSDLIEYMESIPDTAPTRQAPRRRSADA